MISQLRGIAYYEFRMLWRERAQIVITLVLLLMVLIPSLIASNEVNGVSATDLVRFSGTDYNVTQVIVMIMWGPVGVSMALLVPIFLADMIPKDRQIGVRELLDATPLPRGSVSAGQAAGRLAGDVLDPGCCDVGSRGAVVAAPGLA